MPTREDYDRVFKEECAREYPVIDGLERDIGYAIERERLEMAARTLACPVKANPPNWQHGRLIYSLLRRHLAKLETSSVVRCLDIGTAKGFSALCALWAGLDAGANVRVTSVDVIDPSSRVQRNTVADVDTRVFPTLHDLLSPWPEASAIDFKQASGVNWLVMNRRPIEFAFIDGKHNYVEVRKEVELLRTCQLPGAIALFDDVHIQNVRRAVEEMTEGFYDVTFIELKESRTYALAVAVG